MASPPPRHRKTRGSAIGESWTRRSTSSSAGRVGDVAERLEGLERAQLARDRLDHLLAAVADVGVPEARGAVEVALARVVPEVDALAARDHELVAGDGRHVRERVPVGACHRQPPIARGASWRVTLGAGVAGVKREPSATCSVDMSRPDPWLEHYGERRRAPRRVPPAARHARADASRRSRSPWRRRARSRDGAWQPPSGLGGFRSLHVRRSRGGALRRAARARGAAARAGRAIALHVAIIPATRQPARGALFYLEGGPGGAASEAAVKVNEVFAKVSEYRDLVLVDQRGTGGSHALDVPAGARAGDRRGRGRGLRAALLRAPRRRGAPAHERGRGRRHRARAAGARLRPHRRLRQLLRRHARAALPAPPPAFGAHRDARRRLAAEHPGVRAGGAQRRARAARRDRPLPRAAIGVPARVPGHAGRARRVAGRAPAAGRPPGDGDRGAAAHARERGSRPAGRPPGRRRRRRAARARARGARRAASSTRAPAWRWSGRSCAASRGRASTSPRRRGRAAGASSRTPAVARAKLFRQVCSAVPPAPAPPAAPRPSARARAAARRQRRPARSSGEPARLARTFPNGRLVTVPGLAHGVVAYGCLRLLVARFVASRRSARTRRRVRARVPLPRFELS